MSGTELVACEGHVWEVVLLDGQLDSIECLTQPGAELAPAERATAAAIAHGHLIMRRDIGTVDPDRAARWRYILDHMERLVRDATAQAQQRAARALTPALGSSNTPAAC